LAIGPARLGTARARARHGPEDVGPARHAVPPVPGRPGKHGPFSVSGQPGTHDELRAARERGKGRKHERAAGDRGVGVELVAGSGVGAELVAGSGVGAELMAGSGVGAELGASALVPAAAEAGLWEAMTALDVGSHEKRRGWRGFGEPRGSRSSRRRRPAGWSSSTLCSHSRRGLVEGWEERSPRQVADGCRGVLQLVREE